MQFVNAILVKMSKVVLFSTGLFMLVAGGSCGLFALINGFKTADSGELFFIPILIGIAYAGWLLMYATVTVPQQESHTTKISPDDNNQSK